jgi:hypothetical protein
MCSVLAGLTALSGYMQYQGQKSAADAQVAAYKSQAAMAERNAQIENRKQEQIADNYAIQDRRLRAKERLHQGQVRAAAGAAGIDSAGGSPLDIMSAGWDAYEQDKMISLSNQRNENFNSRVAQTDLENRAASYRAAADNTKRVARMQGLATILGTATAIAGTGAFDSLGSKAGSSVSGTYSTPLAGNTTATFTAGQGYSFAPTNLYGKTLMPKTYFPYK